MRFDTAMNHAEAIAGGGKVLGADRSVDELGATVEVELGATVEVDLGAEAIAGGGKVLGADRSVDELGELEAGELELEAGGGKVLGADRSVDELGATVEVDLDLKVLIHAGASGPTSLRSILAWCDEQSDRPWRDVIDAVDRLLRLAELEFCQGSQGFVLTDAGRDQTERWAGRR